MVEKNTGIEFEKLTESIFKKLMRNPAFEKVEHDIKLNGADGLRQIDVLITNTAFGMRYTTVIECRDFNKKLSIGNIDGFHSKLLDVKASKGILISKKGFSSKAIAKAKRLGIVLCTAGEACKDNWDPQIDLPILIREIKPVEYKIGSAIRALGKTKVRFDEEKIKKGFDIVELIKNKWKDGKMEFQRKTGFQQVEIEEIKRVDIFRDSVNKNLISEEFEFYLNLDIQYYKVNASELRGAQMLNNISDGKNTFFVDVDSLSSIEHGLSPVPKTIIKDFIGPLIEIHVIPNFKN